MNNLTTRSYVRQSPEIINGRYSLGKSEGDLVYALLTVIDKRDEDFKDYKFTKAELERKLGVQLDTAKLRKTAENLMSKVLKIYENESKWKLFAWFSSFEYDHGIITCSFDPKMKPYLLQLKQYILVDFKQIIQIQSEYSRRMFFYLKERQKFGMRTFVIKDLMAELEAPTTYREYKHFKRYVLNQTIKDINRYTDMQIENIGTKEQPKYFEEHKVGKKVEKVTFYFKKNWVDLKSFIEYVRELYVNEPLYPSFSKPNSLLKCSKYGILYYGDTLVTIDSKTAQKEWEWLHDNRERLFCFNSESVVD